VTPPAFLGGIRSLARRYDTFILDVWGTLHDGVRVYPGALNALKKLTASGIRVALLSNAPRRATPTAAMLDAMGISASLYQHLVTSGESVHAALRDRSDCWYRHLHGPCWHLGLVRDRSIFEGLDLDLREVPRGAGFSVVTGPRLGVETVADYQPQLDEALAAGLPMICANPDISVPAGDMMVTCAGAFASYYAAQGGEVRWHGKPYPGIYDRLFSELATITGRPVEPGQTLAIGDGLHTDIAGAAAVGIDSVLLTNGVHRLELKVNWRGRPAKTALAALLESAKAPPTYMSSRFAW
jgi:HAD superfamily hydrolase (TIGR01459 family)